MSEASAAPAQTEPASAFQTRDLPASYDVLAPDTSEIRVLAAGTRGSMAHGTLPPGRVSLAVRHQTVEELWFVVSGQAEIWRKLGDEEATVIAGPGTSLSIPVGTHFQFRTVGDEPFCFIMVTMPPWPGPGEAVRVPDHWPVPGEPR
jgi:mannose-6-phosphate isomerase-like protein (cupin superfamily)